MRLDNPPFIYQWDHEASLKHADEQIQVMKPFTKANAIQVSTREVEQLMADHPDDCVGRASLAFLEEANNEQQKALQEWDQIIERMPHMFKAHRQKAKICEELRLTTKSQEAYLTCLKINPYHVDSMLGLARLCLVQEKWLETISWCNRALTIRPDEGSAHRWKGFAFYKMGKYTESLGEYKTAVGMGPKDLPGRMEYAQVLTHENLYNDAIREYQIILGTNPANIPALLELADVQWRNKQVKEAKSTLERLLLLSPNHEKGRQMYEAIQRL
jgi:tetratricopeptide (TPR) repeat protein